MEVQQVLHMKGGEDHASYAKNSSCQRLASMKVSSALKQSIQEFCRVNLPAAAGCINIADLGCASGPNTFLVIQDIIENINREFRESNIYLELPSIQVFLNDLVSNEFNSIFRSLPNFYQRLGDYYGRSPGSCFIAAMPGSFHGRLFPDNSMHFVYSSYSLHWLSQVPSGLVSGDHRRFATEQRQHLHRKNKS
ncbi:unnamed protein product [Coffea canephora]|uniref:Jasmonate O-methyltransferase n=1 Tax=Coffea canephora TaxID=49390 RepID=A0A068VAV5_COFCA|nr:unnamed protein product [Coffea canephora]